MAVYTERRGIAVTLYDLETALLASSLPPLSQASQARLPRERDDQPALESKRLPKTSYW